MIKKSISKSPEHKKPPLPRPATGSINKKVIKVEIVTSSGFDSSPHQDDITDFDNVVVNDVVGSS